MLVVNFRLPRRSNAPALLFWVIITLRERLAGLKHRKQTPGSSNRLGLRDRAILCILIDGRNNHFGLEEASEKSWRIQRVQDVA